MKPLIPMLLAGVMLGAFQRPSGEGGQTALSTPLASLPLGQTGQSPPSGTAFLYSFFRDPDGLHGLCLAYSTDLFHWKEIPGPIFEPKVSETTKKKGYSHKVFRDPFLAPDPAGGFHLVWTTSWSSRNIGYAYSKDLIHWEREKAIPVMEDRQTALNCWAPKLFYDSAKKQWLIFWSTDLSDGTFPKSEVPNTTANHRIWYTTTADFKSFSPPRVFFDPGYPVIDAFLLRDGDKYHLFFKDSRSNNRRVAAIDPQYLNIRVAHAASPYGPFTDISDPITGRGPGKWANEGPCAIKFKGMYYAFYDHYGDDAYYGAVRSKDLEHWEEATSLFAFPQRSKHGHIFEVSRDVLTKRSQFAPHGF